MAQRYLSSFTTYGDGYVSIVICNETHAGFGDRSDWARSTFNLPDIQRFVTKGDTILMIDSDTHQGHRIDKIQEVVLSPSQEIEITTRQNSGTHLKVAAFLLNPSAAGPRGGGPRPLWTATGRKTTLMDGSTRVMYKNPKFPGQLRIRKMRKGRDGKLAATYVVPPAGGAPPNGAIP